MEKWVHRLEYSLQVAEAVWSWWKQKAHFKTHVIFTVLSFLCFLFSFPIPYIEFFTYKITPNLSIFPSEALPLSLLWTSAAAPGFLPASSPCPHPLSGPQIAPSSPILCTDLIMPHLFNSSAELMGYKTFSHPAFQPTFLAISSNTSYPPPLPPTPPNLPTPRDLSSATRGSLCTCYSGKLWAIFLNLSASSSPGSAQ